MPYMHKRTFDISKGMAEKVTQNKDGRRLEYAVQRYGRYEISARLGTEAARAGGFYGKTGRIERKYRILPDPG